MDRGLYIAASGMLAEQVRQDQLASDLANASTPGYKSDRAVRASFGDVLLANRQTGEAIGSVSLGTGIAALSTDLTQGALRETGEPLDVALEGEGFLVVDGPDGRLYTRNGQLSRDAQGRLVTSTGLPVLGDDDRPLVLPAGADPAIAADGTVTVGGRRIGRLAVVTLTDVRKQGDNLFAGTAGARPAGTGVRQRFLESSAVDPTRTMVDLIESMRSYEAGQRVLRAIDETLQRGIAAGGGSGT